MARLRTAALALAAATAATGAAAQPQLVPTSVTVDPSTNLVELRNGFTRLIFNPWRGSFDVWQGRFEGDGDFAGQPNLAPGGGAANCGVPSAPVSLPRGLQQGALCVVVTGSDGGLAETSTCGDTASAPAAVAITSNASDLAGFVVTLTDGPTPAGGSPRISATLNVSLAAASRAISVVASVSATSAFTATAVRLMTAWTPASSTVVLQKGVRQGMAMSSPYLATYSPWAWWYGMGRSGAVDITPADNATAAFATVITASHPWHGRQSGLDVLFEGLLPSGGWLDGFEGGVPVPVAAGTAWTAALSIAANGYDFPARNVPALPTSPSGSGGAPVMAVDDLRAILTAVYGSPMSSLHSFDYWPEGRQAPCIQYNGGVCYGGMYNFFDPDSGMHISAMALSFDPLVWAEAKKIIETNEAHLCPQDAPASRCQPGQAMHHFVPDCNGAGPSCVCTRNPANPLVTDCVSYAAISGAVQTGPNLFWAWATMTLAAVSGDAAWLAARMPALRYGASFLLRALHPDVGLLLVGNSLMIDTFIRANYTADTNAAAVLMFEKMADAEAAVGNATGSSYYAGVATTIRSALPKYLLAASGDHFCTNSDPIPGGGVKVCARDFIDYDANLLAVWAGAAPSKAVAQAILDRVDSGPCAHVNGGTWVSEVYYNASNCNANNTGDSAVAMGRIAWADGHARRAMGDAANAAIFSDVILAPLQSDLLASTWMYERFQCQGKTTHSPYYVEYPETVALLLFEVKYGLQVGSTYLTVDPIVVDAAAPPAWDVVLGSGETAFHVGFHGGTGFTAELPYTGTRAFTVTHVRPGTWAVTVGGAAQPVATVGADGVLAFTAALLAKGTTVAATWTGAAAAGGGDAATVGRGSPVAAAA